MTDDSDFEEEGWEEAYAELINSLQDVDLCTITGPHALAKSK